MDQFYFDLYLSEYPSDDTIERIYEACDEMGAPLIGCTGYDDLEVVYAAFLLEANSFIEAFRMARKAVEDHGCTVVAVHQEFREE